eukprot:scaffold21096_cov90-Isochrysis_galbana.AAC.2
MRAASRCRPSPCTAPAPSCPITRYDQPATVADASSTAPSTAAPVSARRAPVSLGEPTRQAAAINSASAASCRWAMGRRKKGVAERGRPVARAAKASVQAEKARVADRTPISRRGGPNDAPPGAEGGEGSAAGSREQTGDVSSNSEPKRRVAVSRHAVERRSGACLHPPVMLTSKVAPPLRPTSPAP